MRQTSSLGKEVIKMHAPLLAKECLEKIKKGTVFSEYFYGNYVAMRATQDAHTNADGQVEWMAERVDDGKLIYFLITPHNEHYGPEIYV